MHVTVFCLGLPSPGLACLSLYPTINNFARRLGKAVQVPNQTKQSRYQTKPSSLDTKPNQAV